MMGRSRAALDEHREPEGVIAKFKREHGIADPAPLPEVVARVAALRAAVTEPLAVVMSAEAYESIRPAALIYGLRIFVAPCVPADYAQVVASLDEMLTLGRSPAETRP